ncbi:Reverse transcriptase domain [Cinara cedri]|uniref:Reverse transcriptase domain n=1 Tax=Cinara cedri TaxID=506608 RepID=A0A5E4NST3_9HEMI|nr:Reverse transcriptase domain [Cinara cedri]
MTIDAEIFEDHQNDTEEVDQSIMREEFDKALMELKNKKTPGVDEIPAELIQNCGYNTKKIIYEMIKKCYETGQVPSDFTKCIIVPIPKKTTAKTCEQHRTLNLISHASKILTRIVLKRMEPVIDELLTEEQFGFRRGKGTREAILALRQVIEKQNRKRKTTFIAFVDLKKAFDNDGRIIKSLYKQEIGVIRCENSREEAEIRKGCTLSPSLFNLYVQEAVNKVREEIEVGIRINGERIDMLRFADDIAVITDNEEDLQNILEIMNLAMKNEYNMKNKQSKNESLCL